MPVGRQLSPDTSIDLHMDSLGGIGAPSFDCAGVRVSASGAAELCGCGYHQYNGHGLRVPYPLAPYNPR